ncbi:MAG: hypothetical protein LBN71_01870 [Tannerella sp.]|jgi:hypothetical protein|nr:hypothetical protein [Tannerella sp.]
MDIEQLLKKFYDGDTTLEEERLLKEYFVDGKKVEERWKNDQQLFWFLFVGQRQMAPPPGLSKRLEKSITQMTKPQRIPLRKKAIFYWISSVAAVILICIGLFFTVREPSQPVLADTFDDPTEAAVAAGQALAFMSAQLNKGLDRVADAEQKVEKVNQVLNKHLNP